MKLDQSFLLDVKNIWLHARRQAYTLVNQAMVEAYWQIGNVLVLSEVLRRLAKEIDQ